MFSARQTFFNQLILILFTFVMPLVLYKITHNPITIWFYFSTTSFFWVLLTSSFLAQAFGFILILSMYWLNNWQRIIILFLSIITHSTTFYIAIGFFALLLIQEHFKKNPYKGFQDLLPKALACSPIWGSQGAPEVLANPIVNTGAHPDAIITLNTLLSVFVKRTPLPFLLMSLKGLIDRRELALLGLMAVSFAGGLLIHERGFNFAGLPMVIGLTFFFEKSDKKWKIGIIVLSIIYFLFNIQQLHAFIGNCLALWG